MRFGGRRCPSHAELREPPSCTGGSLSPVSAQRFVHFSSCCYLGPGTDFWQHARPGQQREKLRSRRWGRKRGRGGRRSPPAAAPGKGRRAPPPAPAGSYRSQGARRPMAAAAPGLARGAAPPSARPSAPAAAGRLQPQHPAPPGARRGEWGAARHMAQLAPAPCPPLPRPRPWPRPRPRRVCPAGGCGPRYSLATAPRALGWKVAGVLPALSAGRMTETALFIRSLFHSL